MSAGSDVGTTTSCHVANHPDGVETCWGEAHGRCVNDRCDCNPWYYGEFCQYKKCPDGCNGHGSCLHMTHDDSECLCHPCWDGVNCSWALPRINAWQNVRPHHEKREQMPAAPANRTRCAGTSMCGDLIIFGGEADDERLRTEKFPIGGQRGVTNDVWVFDFSNDWKWRPLMLDCIVPIPARQAHTISHVYGRSAWVFGGLDSRSKLRNDLWEINVEARTCRPMHTSCPECARPESRAFHAAATDRNGTLWIFGGQSHSLLVGGVEYLNDLWRVRCRPQIDGTCDYYWGDGRTAKFDAAPAEAEERLQYGAPADLGGGILWLKLENFQQPTPPEDPLELDYDPDKKALPVPSVRAGASLVYFSDGAPAPKRRLYLFGGYDGAEYLNDLWEWVLPHHDDGDEYYQGNRLKAYYPFQDAMGRWRRISAPGDRPSGRDGFLGLKSPAPGGLMYIALGRASDKFPQQDSGTVWAFDPSEELWKKIPARNQGDNILGREESCGGIAQGYGGDRIFTFGGDSELSTFDSNGGGHRWVSDELWLFDGGCAEQVVSRRHPFAAVGTCPGTAEQYPKCPTNGYEAPGSTPCLGQLYPVNDFANALPQSPEPDDIRWDPELVFSENPAVNAAMRGGNSLSNGAGANTGSNTAGGGFGLLQGQNHGGASTLPMHVEEQGRAGIMRRTVRQRMREALALHADMGMVQRAALSRSQQKAVWKRPRAARARAANALLMDDRLDEEPDLAETQKPFTEGGQLNSVGVIE